MAGSLSAGSTYVDVLPNMTKFGPATAAGVTKSTASLGSKLKGSFGTLGLVMGATFAVGFAKSSLAAFDEAMASERAFNAALERTGQIAKINADTFNKWLLDFALAIGKSDEDLRAMAERLVTAFDFTRYGDDAQQVLQDTTATIFDMATATGRAEGTMTKLFLTLLNDPAKALPQFQRFGVITEEQADHFAEMAEAGDSAMVTTELLTIAHEKYAGRAAVATTEGEKLSAAWGEMQETVGMLLSKALFPIMKVFTNLFSIFAKYPNIIYPVTAAIIALVIAMKAEKIGLFFGRMKAGTLLLTGLPAKLGALTSMIGSKLIPGLTGAAASAATLGAALVIAFTAYQAIKLQAVISDIYEFNNAAEAADNRAAALSYTLAVRAGGSVEELREAYRRLKDEFSVDNIDLVNATMETLNRQVSDGTITWEEYQRALTPLMKGLDKEVAPIVESLAMSFDEVTAAVGENVDGVKGAGRTYIRFAGMTKKEFGTWADSIVTNFQDAAGGLTGFNRVFTVTARQLERNAERVRRTLQQEKEDLDALLALGLDDEVVQRLQEEGPAAIRAFMSSSEEGRRNVVEDIVAIINKEKELENRIRGVDAGAKIFANTARENLGPDTRYAGDQFGYLADEADRAYFAMLRAANVPAPHGPTGTGGGSTGEGRTGPPREDFATGGIVTRPTIALIGEAGPEAVVPLSGRGSGEMTLRIVDWRNGIARLGDEIDWDDEGRP